MPKLVIKGFNPLQTSEKANLFIIPKFTTSEDELKFAEREVFNEYINSDEYECTLPEGDYAIHIMSMVYNQINGIKITMDKDRVVNLKMEVDFSYRPPKDSDYLKTRGWHLDSKNNWTSPHLTVKHFDTFLCAKFNEFLDNQAKIAEKDIDLSELHSLRIKSPSTWENAMWIKYREITHEDYKNFVVDNIIDA